MKNKLILLGFAAIFWANSISSQTLFVDDFSYGPLTNLSGANGWYQSGATTPNKVTVTSPGLVYSGYQGSGYGNKVQFSNITEGDIVLHDFTPVTSGSVYIAFMINVVNFTDSATSGYNVAFDQSGGATAIKCCVFVRKLTSTIYNMGIGKTGSSVTYSPAAFVTGNTYAVVAKYTFSPGSTGNDTCKLYAFASGMPSTEPASTPAVNWVGGDATDIGQVVLSNSYIQNGLKSSHVTVDGIRVGTTWLGAVLTSLNQTETTVPDNFSLSQNYPNPFNPSTKISFSIPQNSFVKLSVYDITGKVTSDLVDQQLSAGSYTYEFNASTQASGVYFYKLEAGDFVSVKKMVLVK